jgi:hypothetical protein
LVGENRRNSEKNLFQCHFIKLKYYIKLAGRFGGKKVRYVTAIAIRARKHERDNT